MPVRSFAVRDVSGVRPDPVDSRGRASCTCHVHGRLHAHVQTPLIVRPPAERSRGTSGPPGRDNRIDSVTVAPNSDKNSTGARMRATLAAVAPGTELREGLERILRGRTGALLVVGHDKTVDSISTGGFEIDVEFSATGLRELSKMDGAIILDRDVSRLIRAAVHLMPDPSIFTDETGTRHRTADRVARQTGFPVISVSQSMHIIALYVDDQRYVLEDSGAILSRANQALATLERYKLRLDEVSGTLSALEIEDLVTVRDVAAVAQRLEMVRRIATEIDGYVVELGTDGRLLTLQLNELVAGVAGERELVVRDYLPPATGRKAKTADDVLLELDAAVTPRGYRLLAKVPRLPGAVIDRLIDHFGHLQKLLAASIDDLQTVEGVGENRARTVREGLSRLAESSILERYV